MITLSKHLFLSLSTAKNLSKNKGIKKFCEIFVIRFFYAFDFIRNFFNSKKKYDKEILSEKYFEENISTNQVLSDLNIFGYNNFLKLKEDYLNLIKEEISLKNSTISYKEKKSSENLQDHLSDESNLNNIFLKSLEKKISHVALDINLAKTSYIQELATSNFFMDLSKKYINNDRVSVSALCYISNPTQTSESEKKDNAQYFHYDNDFKKFFKVFIYLNDVSLAAGPHSFVSKTNSRKKFKHIVAERIDDKEIKKFYNTEDIKIFDGKKGNIIIEDTFGLHKGTPPSKDSRIVLILIFGYDLGIDIYKNSLIKKINLDNTKYVHED